MRILEMRNSELDSLMNGEGDSESFFERHGIQTYNLVDVVSAAKRVIDCRGFEPSDSMNATWKFIIDEYDRTKVENEALDAIEWIKSLSENEVLKSNYLFNLKQIIDVGYCTARHFGFLASLIPSYRKSEYKRLLDLKKNNGKVSEYVGNVGDKISIKVKYVNTYSYDTSFGGSHIHLFMDDNGNIFKWSTGTGLRFTVDDARSNDSQWYGLDRGALIQLSGKIKEHSEYRNQKQTVLTRCKYEVLESKERNAKIAELEEYYSKDHNAQTRDSLDDLM